MNNKDWYKEFKEIISKKPLLTLSEKCKTCKQKHPELNRRCDYIYCKIGIKNKEAFYMLNVIIVILLVIGGFAAVMIGCLLLCSIPLAIFLIIDKILYKIRRSK